MFLLIKPFLFVKGFWVLKTETIETDMLTPKNKMVLFRTNGNIFIGSTVRKIMGPKNITNHKE